METKLIEWLSELKAGDEVVVTGTYLTALLTVTERLSDSRIVTTWGNGTIIFDSYGRLPNGVTRLIPPTPELRQSIERGELEGMMRNVLWGACSLEQLRKIAEILK